MFPNSPIRDNGGFLKRTGYENTISLRILTKEQEHLTFGWRREFGQFLFNPPYPQQFGKSIIVIKLTTSTFLNDNFSKTIFRNHAI